MGRINEAVREGEKLRDDTRWNSLYDEAKEEKRNTKVSKREKKREREKEEFVHGFDSSRHSGFFYVSLGPKG